MQDSIQGAGLHLLGLAPVESSEQGLLRRPDGLAHKQQRCKSGLLTGLPLVGAHCSLPLLALLLLGIALRPESQPCEVQER